MKPVKRLGLAALAALMAMAFAGAGSAMAESTALCNVDPGTGAMEPCPSGHLNTHVHETTLAGAKAILLGSPQVECDVLFLGDTVSPLRAPLLAAGNYSYSNCSSSCTVKEENGPAVNELLKAGHERADVLLEFLIHVSCFGIECYYKAEGMPAASLGPLLSKETNGELWAVNQTIPKEKGLFCGASIKLDIALTPLSATYVTT